MKDNDFIVKRSGASPYFGMGGNIVASDAGAFRQRRSIDTVVKKKGKFFEASQNGKPTLALWYSTAADERIHLSLLDLNGTASKKDVPNQRVPRLGNNAPSLHNGRIKMVSDKLFLALLGNANDVANSLGSDVITWPSLMRVDTPIRQRLLSEDQSLGTAVTYIDSIQVTGLPEYEHNNEPHALGWDGTSYRYGYSFTFPADSSKKYETRAPNYFTGNTANFLMVQVPLPFYPNRDHPGFSAYVIGPGRLQALMVVTEDWDKTQLPPYFVNTSDYGSSWFASDASFIQPFLFQHPETPPEPPDNPGRRAYYDETQLSTLSRYTVNAYVGNNKNILVIPNGMYQNVGGNAPRYCPMAFIGTGGGGYTRLSWPLDTWNVSADGTGTSDVGLAFYAQDHRNAHLGFGVGCFYLLVNNSNQRKWIVTHDFGATWTLRPIPTDPAGLSGGVLANYGTIVKPYLSADDPGEILFAYVDLTSGRVDVVRTDGKFQEFQKTGAVLDANEALSSGNGLLYSPTGAMNQYLTNYGASKRPYIFPAFPGEFDKP